ncbi:MAG: hypothetical protein AAB944_01815 [Patescibacteria group bacterium]|mgnify:CR=1 FL=1
MSFLKRKSSGEPIVIFDIGSASVGGAIVLLSESTHLPKIIYTKRIFLPIAERPQSDEILTSSASALKEIIVAFEKEGLSVLHDLHIRNKVIHDVFCVLASPWYVSQTKTITIKEKKPIILTEKFIETVLAKEEKAFEESIAHSSYAETFDKNIILAEQKIIHIKLSGYETNEPYGKKSSDIELSLFSSFVSKKISEKLSETIGHSFGGEKIKLHSFCLTSFSTLSDLFPEAKDFLIMDITGEVTDISIVRNGTLVQSASFPSGRNFLIRKMTKKMNSNTEVALSSLSLYSTGKAEPAVAVKIESVVKEVQEEWLVYLNDLLKDIKAEIGILPRKIFLTVDNDVLPLFLKFLKQSPDNFEPIVLDEKQLARVVEVTKGVVADPFIAIEAIFLNKLFQTKS